MPITSSPLELLATFLIVYVISALSTVALTWLMDKTNRSNTCTPK